jgi:hypothetical protein
LVDALVLGTSGAIHGGSSPLPGTNKISWYFCASLFLSVLGLEPEEGSEETLVSPVEESWKTERFSKQRSKATSSEIPLPGTDKITRCFCTELFLLIPYLRKNKIILDLSGDL